MYSTTLKLVLIIILNIIINQINAQSSIVSTGNNVIGIEGSVSYSVGQLNFAAHNTTEGIITEGMQQPYEISIVTNYEKGKAMDIECLAYPNPTNDYLMLKIDLQDFDKLQVVYQLFNAGGTLIEKSYINNRDTEIEIEHFNAGIYFLKIVDKMNTIKTFKIVKN